MQVGWLLFVCLGTIADDYDAGRRLRIGTLGPAGYNSTSARLQLALHGHGELGLGCWAL